MRKVDLKKDITGNAAATINFEKIVLMHLDKKCEKLGANRSIYVNRIVRKVVLSDVEFWRELEKHHLKQAGNARVEKESAQNTIEVNQ